MRRKRGMKLKKNLSAAGVAKARAEDDLARVQDTLVIAKEAMCKAEAKVATLEVEWTLLLLEVGATKDEVSSLQFQASKDKLAMEEDYEKALELIFVYGYGCCMFKHNICDDQPKVPNAMHDSSYPLSPEFFMNPRCPPVLAATKATTAEVDQNEVARWAKEPERIAPIGDFDGTSEVPSLSFFFFFFFEVSIRALVWPPGFICFYGTIEAIGVFWKFFAI